MMCLLPRLNCSLLPVLLLVLALPPRATACPQLARAPHSQWRVESHQGVQWLRTPCGERFLSLGVNVLDGGYPSRLFEGRLSYHWGTFYADLASWATQAQQRLTAWGFNTLGPWSVASSYLPMPFIPDLEIGRQSHFLWFDPFRPSMAAEMRAWAQRLVAPYKGNPYRIGYFPDNEIGWWYSALLTYYLQQPASSHTKQRLVGLLQEHYADSWEQFLEDFVPPAGVVSFTDLFHSSGVKTQLRPGGAGMQVIGRWTGIVAEHYYRLVHHALREADPEALIFSDRLQIYYDVNAVRPMAAYVDVVATNYDVDGSDGSLARYYFSGLQQLTGQKPVLVSEWFFAAEENRTGNRNQGHLMTVQSQEERARGAMAAAQQFVQLPELIGLHWFQYYDHPVGGRPDGEDYNFGLVDIHDRPYEALTTAFQRLNPRLAALHQTARRRLPASPVETPLAIPEWTPPQQGRVFQAWPKAQAFVPGLTAPSTAVVFGDVYLAWDRDNLYLSLLAMDYYDPSLPALTGALPLTEAFRLEWGVEAGAGPQRFALYVLPPQQFPSDGTVGTQVRFCRLEDPQCAPVTLARARYTGTDTPRIMAEIALPWTALGLTGPPTTRQVRMELAVTAYHRARWMSWSGRPPVPGMQDTTTWHLVRLGEPPPLASGPPAPAAGTNGTP
ncbi:MAG: hypothetical protein AB7N91_09865 [Candidatus Tectimicrobiota bacterium]